MIVRQIQRVIAQLQNKFPVLAITGPRQSGKTTLIKNLFSDYIYISLEDPDIRSFAETDPVAFLEIYNSQVIFDEVQRVPSLFSYIQTRVDASGQMGQYILSGSQNFQLLHQITQSLAGRVALFKLSPFDFRELESEKLLPESYLATIVHGFYPAIFDRHIPPTIFYANYLQTYVERDVVELINIRELRLFRTFLTLCAARAGQLLNLNALATECGVTQPTARAWLTVLESSYLVFLLSPYYRNLNKRAIKTPKLYFYDTGLLCYLLGIRDSDVLLTHPAKGALFENLIIAEKLKQNYHLYTHDEYYFWRDSNGNEVDLINPRGAKFDIFEIKSTQTIMAEHFRGLAYLKKIAPEAVGTRTLIYGGLENQQRSEYLVQSWRSM
ncbi:ATP-binding protein [Telluribacter sp.]|jgi:hypothetical protein|uniref:ATP-binding protein n=1 Tax=Telluribacter sp. TaxID=1978767 RepID=UPI002E1030C9|nr:ATP-binding protein [Telluribacter sp.]